MTRSEIRLVIGIPTVARRRDYVERTVTLLLRRRSPELDAQVRFVLLNAHEPPATHRAVDVIRRRHRDTIRRDILRVVDAPGRERWAPAGTTVEKQWQVKQVLDAAELMEYCSPLGTHYLHLEDDVVPAVGYIPRILDFIAEEEQGGGWHALAFYSPTPAEHRGPIELASFYGCIGLVFRCADLPALVSALRQRKDEGPVDELITSHLAARGHELRAHMPSLFDHVGLQSSLRERVQTSRAWRWAEDPTPVHRFLNRALRSLRVRWLWWKRSG